MNTHDAPLKFVLVCAVIGTILVVVGQALQPLSDDATNAALLTSMATDHGRWALGTSLLFGASIALSATALGLLLLGWNLLGTFGRFASGLLFAALSVTFALDSSQMMQIAMADDRSHRVPMSQAIDRYTGSVTGHVVLVVFLLGLFLGTVMLGITAWRRRLAPRWACVVLGLSGIADLAVSQPLLEAVALGALGFGLATIAAGLGRTRAETVEQSHMSLTVAEEA